MAKETMRCFHSAPLCHNCKFVLDGIGTAADTDEDLFQDAFHEWLEAHGVSIGEYIHGEGFSATIDLNTLKAAMMERDERVAAAARVDERHQTKYDIYQKLDHIYLEVDRAAFDERGRCMVVPHIAARLKAAMNKQDKIRRSSL